VQNISDVRLMEIHRAEPLVPDPIWLDAENAIAKLEEYNCLVVIKFWQNWYKQEVEYYCV
jgi:hypothetical protein